MDAKRFKDAYAKLDLLDERLTYRIRSRSRGGLSSPTTEQLDARLKELAAYTLELEEILRELFLALGTRSS